MYALRSVCKARLCFIIMFSHHLHLDSTTSSSYELLKSNFIFAFAESKKRREGINPELACWTPLCCHLRLCGGSLSTGGDRKPAAFPGKKALCPLCCSCWLLAGLGKEKKIQQASSKPQSYFWQWLIISLELVCSMTKSAWGGGGGNYSKPLSWQAC